MKNNYDLNYNQNINNRIRDNVTGYQTLQKSKNYTLGTAQNYSTNTDFNNGNNFQSTNNMLPAGMKAGNGIAVHRLGGGRQQLQRVEKPKYQPTYESTHAISSNAYANGSNQNCGNVMTGRSSTRIHAPPGGHTQWTLG